MEKASFIIGGYNNNNIFDINNESISRDNCIYYLYELKQNFLLNGIDLSTVDINSLDESIIHIYVEMPSKLPKNSEKNKSFLIILESELIKPDNFNLDHHKYFNKIFTWNDDLVDNKKYFKINFSFSLEKYDYNNAIAFKDKKFCTMIAGHRCSNRANELYSERIKAIKWFEKNFPNSFDLYGTSWDKFIRKNSSYFDYFFVNFLNNLKIKPNFKLYRGPIKSKNETLKNYKFSICYENAKNINGYITEKIFDCFFASCVPIYWGAPNIEKHIPKGCFILKENFKNYHELYNYLNSMNEKEYFNYINNILSFLKGNSFEQFSSEYFSKIICNQVLSSYKDIM